MRVLFIDDHALIRESLAPYFDELEENCEVVGVGTLVAALEKANETWNLVLLDLHMPGVSGLDGLVKLKQALPSIPIVILSGDLNADVIEDALGRGAAGFVPKTLRKRVFINAIRGILEGEAFVPAQILGARSSPPKVRAQDDLLHLFQKLTHAQADVLRLVVEGKNSRDIGITLGTPENKVKVQLRAAYRQIGAKNRADVVRKAFESGWYKS